MVANALSRYPEQRASMAEAENNARHPYQYANNDEVIVVGNISVASPVCDGVAALSEWPDSERTPSPLVFNAAMLKQLRDVYDSDPWCAKLASAARGMENLQIHNGLWFLGERLIVPGGCNMHELIFRAAHDCLGHFGFPKMYGSICGSYFWPNMCTNLKNTYVPGCADCQRNKNGTKKPAGPLHPLPVPDNCFDSIALDFIGPLPEENGLDCILTMTNRLGADVHIVPTRMDLTAKQLAVVFFDHWYCENGLPLEVVSDRDKLFVSRFWQALAKLTGISLKMSSAFHPQSDGASKHSNKTVNQSICFHVERNQSGWKRALLRVRFNMMNTVNASTGFSPFQLRLGRSARMLPPLVAPNPLKTSRESTSAAEIISRLQIDVADARDNLVLLKISQSYHTNKSRADDPPYKIIDLVLLSTLNRRREYKRAGSLRVAKFMPQYDGPFEIIDTFPHASMVTLNIPHSNVFPTFHTSLLKPFVRNDVAKFPLGTLESPRAVIVDGEEEYFVDKIVDDRMVGKRKQYLVKWVNEGPQNNRWIAAEDLEENEALDVYLGLS